VRPELEEEEREHEDGGEEEVVAGLDILRHGWLGMHMWFCSELSLCRRPMIHPSAAGVLPLCRIAPGHTGEA
jgi:hypothetical protein